MEKIPQGKRGGGDSGLRPNSERRNLHGGGGGGSSGSYYVLKAAHTRGGEEGRP